MNLFGFEFKRKSSNQEIGQSVITPTPDDGSVLTSSSSSYYGLVIDVDTVIKNENDLIRRYREISQYSDCETAIEEIVNDAIVSDPNTPIVSISLDALQVTPQIKEIISQEFDRILTLLNFDEKAYDMFRTWYIDGRIYYHVVVDETNPQNGIIELRIIDPRKIRKITNIEKQRDPRGYDIVTNIDEYFLYNNTGITEQSIQGVRLSKDSVVYCTSGLVDANTNMVLSHLHGAIKPTNMLKMIEDSLVIYRITRSSERRVFYVDVGNLSKFKAEQYVNDLMLKYRNKMVYDANTGTVSENKRHMAMVEDFWMPRREGGRGTEITTLPGGCLAMDTSVSLLDGRELTITEIAAEMESGKELWTYSCEPKTGKIVPGLISWAGVTQKSAKVMKITLDNGSEIIATPDHKWPQYGEEFKRTDNLQVGDSLIPLYRDKISLYKGKNSDYERIFDNNEKKWKFTHRVVADTLRDVKVNHYTYNASNSDISPLYEVRHHIDKNRFNNDPNNLCFMSWKDHTKLHSDDGFSPETQIKGTLAASKKFNKFRNEQPEEYAEYCKNIGEQFISWRQSLTEEELVNHNKKISNGIKEYLANLSDIEYIKRRETSSTNIKKAEKVYREKRKDPLFVAWVSEQMSLGWTDEKRKKHSIVTGKHSKQRWNDPISGKELRKGHKERQKLVFSHNMLKFIIDCVSNKTTHEITIKDVTNELNNNITLLTELCELNKHKTVPNWNVNIGFTHNIVLKLVQSFGFSNWIDFRKKESIHNHKIVAIEYLDNPIEVGTLTIDTNEQYHNFHTFALSCGVFTKNSNLSDISDIEYFQMKLFQSLKVPLSRLQPQTNFSLGRPTETSREEVKFNKFIERLRKKFSFIFKDTLKIQLILKGIIRPDEWDMVENFVKFDFQRDNYFSELKESEIMQQRAAMLNMVDPYVGKYFSSNWVRKHILMQTEQDIEEMEFEMQQDQQLQIEQQAQQQAMMMKMGLMPTQDGQEDTNNSQANSPTSTGQ